MFLGHPAILCTRISPPHVRLPHVLIYIVLLTFVALALFPCLNSSTDPAHNLSDAFSQKFSKDATQVNGYTNLYAMEIDPSGSMQEMIDSNEGGQMGGMLQDLAFAIPGVDEAMGFAEIMK